ncbi:alpha/beta fold hydrolase [uncultured Sphingomonas sp.]|uniref:alpha/beta fold hydrolase n=1 Tax=uncultured Sphingomonas sp. TaxID=158754 RepID=UPI0035CA17D3
MDAPPSFVLIHGSWLGGWCWRRVEDRLRAKGFRVFSPTMTGVGDRSHLIDGTITLDTWITDILQLLDAEELRDVILVGHSFGGRIVTGVADRVAERIRGVVFLDSALAENGQSLMDQLNPSERARRLASAEPSGGLSIPPPSASQLGVIDPADQAWVDRRITPQPLGTNTTPLVYDAPIGAGRPVTFVEFTYPSFPVSARAAAFARSNAGWRVLTVATGHCGMITAPDAVTEMLSDAAAISPVQTNG